MPSRTTEQIAADARAQIDTSRHHFLPETYLAHAERAAEFMQAAAAEIAALHAATGTTPKSAPADPAA